jgi:hypothetical protein
MDQLALFNVIDNTPMVATTAPEERVSFRPAPVPQPDWKMGLALLDFVTVAGVPNWSEGVLGHGVIVGFNESTRMVQVDLPRPDGNGHIYLASPERLTKIGG